METSSDVKKTPFEARKTSSEEDIQRCEEDIAPIEAMKTSTVVGMTSTEV